MAFRDGSSYGTWVAEDELERPQREALQRALEAMTPPGLVQQGTMLRERFDALGPVRAAARTADDLTGLFGRLGPISPLEALSPARLGARAGAAAGRAVAESEAGVEAELRAGETLARAGPAATQARERLGQVGADLLPRVVPDERQPGGERVELGGITRHLPLPPALQGLRPGAEGYVEDLATAGRYVAQRPREVAAAVDTAAGFLPEGPLGGRFLTRTLPRVVRGEGRQVLGELGQALPALGAAGTLVPLPAVQGGNLVANLVEEPLLGAGVNPAVAGTAGLLADVLTPSPGDVPRIGARLPRVAEDLRGLAGAARRGLDRFGQAAAEEAVDEVSGVRRGQQIRIPPLTPEQQVQRAADGAAEQRVFDAIRALWRRGPAGEEIADELRFLSVGKGEAGEAAARELLASRGLEDVLPPPTAAGVLPPSSTTAGEGVLGLARRATEPLMARGAVTPGERAFDLATGTAGGVVGAATAEEDATWQERVGRGALGASLGALGGANLRQLGRVARGALADEALGAVPRSAQTHPEAYPSATGVETQQPLPGFREPPQIGPLYRPPGATYPGTRAPFPERPPAAAPAGGPSAAAAPESALARAAREAREERLGIPPEQAGPPLEEAAGRSRWGIAADIATSAPLLRPTSLLGNAASGGFRTVQRWLEESGGALLTSSTKGAGRESVDDLVAMARELIPAAREFGPSVRTGGTQATQSQLGATGQSLVTQPGLRAGLATAGTRLNIATDEFWRQVNRAGAQARAAARGITDPDDVEQLAGSAADFVSFAGKSSRLADFLGGYRRILDDPATSGQSKAVAAFLTSLTPYVKTPERVLMATGRLLTDPFLLPLSARTRNGLVRQAMEGNQEAKREVAGRLLVSGLTYLTGTLAYANGSLYGAPPKDAKLRRRMEAEGAQWNTVAGVPTRFLGSFGQAMAGLGTALLDAQQAAGKGADPTDVARTFFGSAGRWALDESFLRGLSDLDEAVREGRGGQFLEESAVDATTRPLSGLSGFIDPFDPLERERRGTRDALVGALPGGRFALPSRVDPATGQPLKREGSGVERLLLGARGVAESPEARELARLGLTAREFKPQDTVYGHVQTPEARRALQETFGRYTRDYVRDTMARPDYRGASEEVQAATLRRQVGLAQQLADIEVGDRVARDPQARFELEWLRTPQYRGVEGTPDRVARQNLEIREAKQLLDEYQRRFGETPGRYRFYEEHPDLIDFARRPGVPERSLAEQKEAVRRRTGAPETGDRALLGAGNRVLPASVSFVAPGEPGEAPASLAARQQRRAGEAVTIEQELADLIARTRARSNAPTGGGGGGFQFTAP